MTDSMKFGPEWLRNLAGDNCSAGGGGGGSTSLTAPRYQLAEHRYGREEMLALFDRNFKPPETLSSFGTIFIDKAQLPLALTQMTEDESRMWNVGLTSTAVRGRGGSIDRGGRGRTGRGGLYSSPYSRGVGFDEPGDGTRIDTQSFPGRGRPFDRSQSERGWSERNGVSEPGEWNGSTSPRKELTRGPSGGSLMESNWRRHRAGGEDDEGWRVASNNRGEKWGGKSSWRDGTSDKDRADGEGEENRSGGRWEHRGNHRSSYDSHHPSTRSSRPWDPNHHDNHDNLPEWATENPSESGGSFDASGAFHGGMYSDEDEEGGTTSGGAQDSRTRSVSEGNTTNTPKQNNKSASYNSAMPGQTTGRQPYMTTNSANKERPKSLHPFEEKDVTVDQERRSLSPVRIATTPNITPIKAPPPTPEANVRLENFSPRKPQTEASDDRGNERNSGRDSKLVETKKKENTEGNLNIDPAVISMSRHPPLKLPGFLNMNVNMNMNMNTMTANTVRQKTDEDLDRMKEEADALVAKLMADEGSHRGEVVNLLPSDTNPSPGLDASSVLEKWFYRDPQGEVQGPFLASEMAEWWKQGYFQPNLLVRRTCDERFASLGDLMSICGRVPFKPGPAIPPLKSTGAVPSVPNTVPTVALPGSALPKTAIDDPMLLLQYQRMQLMQNQQMFLRQMAITKLSQSDHWPTLSPVEQNQLILQYIFQESEMSEMPMSHNPFVTPLAAQATNPVMQLFNQMQAKSQLENHMAPGGLPNAAQHSAPLGFLQQMIQERSARQNMPGIQPSPINSAPSPLTEDNPIKSLLRQLNVHTNGHPQVPVDSVWPQPPPHITPPFNAQNWLAQVGPIPAMPPGQIPNSLWDIHGKDIKTEQQILEEQNLRLQEDKKKEDLKKLEELKRHEEEILKRQQEEIERQAEALKRHLEEKRRIEEDKRKEEEKRKQEEELKKKEEKKRKEEERKKEEKRKLDEELNKKKQEEEKKRKEEAKRQEEKLRKEEEKRKKLEEEQKKQEEEKKRKEEQAARKAEAEEQARKAEQRRREEEALRKLQERSKAPWAQTTQTSPPTAQASLADIQRLEREKKAEQQRYQQMLQLQMAAQQKAQDAAQEVALADSSKRLQFKWAEKTAASNKQPQVKSLAQIQQEEQERIAKERERQEKTNQKESAVTLQNAGIWGTASQSLTWASSANSGSQAWAAGSSAGGFWDDPSPAKSNSGSKQVNKQIQAKQATAQPQLPQLNNKISKNKTKREEELVKKLFVQNTAKPDDFTQWCNKALAGLQVSVDIPTFIGFLRDIESAYEVKEYVRLYLGDDRLCMDFAKQFLEKRSKWRSSQRPQAQADDLCKPAPAINPNASTEFQEVKSKSKKPKKGKMFKVDSRILGFSVTSAPDRLNVGDRDYGEGF